MNVGLNPGEIMVLSFEVVLALDKNQLTFDLILYKFNGNVAINEILNRKIIGIILQIRPKF